MRLGRTLVGLLASLALLAPVAEAQQAPSLGAPTTTQSAPVVTTDDSSDNGGLATWQELLIFGAGLALLAGIGFAIVGDARERTRRRHGRGAAPAAAGPGPHRHGREAKQRSRARAGRARPAAAQPLSAGPDRRRRLSSIRPIAGSSAAARHGATTSLRRKR